MIFSSPRKRSREGDDDELDPENTAPLGKRTRASLEHTHSFQSATRPWRIPHSSPLRMSNAPEATDYDFNSAASDISSMTDDSMELDMPTARPPSSSQTSSSTAPLSSSWSGPSTWALQDRLPRRADSLISRPIRPKPYPLQGAGAGAIPPTSLHLHPQYTTTERLPSPFDTDEPHTPTTAAGSQFSLLSVSDMDIDTATATPAPSSAPSTPSLAIATPLGIPGASDAQSASFIRKQRQRSGAFISSPSDAARRFQMGYRDDCDKCRDRVPGHMNHFIGT